MSSFFLIFCCKFYERLFAVWRKKRCRIGMGRGLKHQPVSRVYLLHNKCMKRINGNKAILHTSAKWLFLFLKDEMEKMADRPR